MGGKREGTDVEDDPIMVPFGRLSRWSGTGCHCDCRYYASMLYFLYKYEQCVEYNIRLDFLTPEPRGARVESR